MSKSIKAALAANFFVGLSKSAGATFTGSGSMMAEALHSFVDCGNQLLLLFGKRSASKHMCSDHPFGHGKELYFWSFIVAVMLFSLGGAYSIYHGIHKLNNPEPLEHLGWNIGILLFGMFLEWNALKVCLSEIKKKYPKKSLIWFFKETRSPDLLVLFGEDTAALTGLAMAIVAIGASAITGNPMWDALGSVAVGILLCAVAVAILIETKALLIGQSINPDKRAKLYKLLSKHESIEHTVECKTLQLGENALLMLKLRFHEKDSAEELVEDIQVIREEIQEAFPDFKWIVIEPTQIQPEE